MQAATDSRSQGTNRLDDATLLARLDALVERDRTTTAKLLWHLGEVEARGLFRDEGYSSLFEYCVKKLHMSEGEAALRVRAARLGRRFPVVLSKVARGELHLSALRALAPELTEENHRASQQLHDQIRQAQDLLRHQVPDGDLATIVEKASSRRTMSAASWATCVPRWPMATPMSAFFRAGASLTPSPVMATMLSCCW